MAVFRFQPTVERVDQTTWGSGVTRLVLDAGRLEDAREKWFPAFPVRYEPVVAWQDVPAVGARVGKVELVRIDPTGRVDVHPAFGDETVPEDVFDAAVLLGAAMSFLEHVQEEDVADLYQRPETTAWFDEVMRLCPQAEFLEKFFSGFWRWARIRSLVRIPSRVMPGGAPVVEEESVAVG